MDIKLEKKIMKDFPWFEARNIFTGKKLKFPHSCENDDGWFQLIYDCCKEIDYLYKSKNINISNLRIYQIKEKYASLEIYLGNYIERVDEIIEKYRLLSMKTCEICGSPEANIKHRGSWLKTLCNKCKNKLGYKDIDFKKDIIYTI